MDELTHCGTLLIYFTTDIESMRVTEKGTFAQRTYRCSHCSYSLTIEVPFCPPVIDQYALVKRP